MAVPEQIPHVGYIANGQSSEFPITFDLHDPDYLVVTVNKEIPEVGTYSIDMNTLKVVFGVAPNSGDQVELYRETTLNRDTNYQKYDNSFRPDAVNWDFDKIIHILQEQHMIDAELASRLKQEIEWRRTHDANFDELAKMRDAQVFSGLKGYVDTLYSASNPNIFDGVTAGIVFALDKKSVQTHLENIYQQLLEGSGSVIAEKDRALFAEQVLQQNITNEVNRAVIAEQSLDLKINANGVGNRAYKQWSDMDADKANIPAKSKVTVTNDPNPAVNGDYQWDGVTFTKSTYDPLTQAKGYVDLRIMQDASPESVVFRSSNGNTLLLMTKNGGIMAVGLDTTIQQAILNLRADLEEQDLKLSYDTSASIFNIKDINGKVIAAITDRSTMHIGDLITATGSVEKRLGVLEENSSTNFENQLLKTADRNLAGKDSEPHLAEITIFNNAMAGWGNTFLPPLIIRVSKNRFFSVCAAGAGGDFGTTRLIGRFFTIDINNSVALEPISIIADYGSDSDGNFSRTNGVPYQVESGPHAGRIYIYYLKRYSEVKDVPCYIYSDDSGVTWSAEVDMTSFFPDYANWRLVVVGPGKVIQLKNGPHKGRIIIPCWHGDPNYPGSQAGLKSFILYSDDGGVTYTIGAESVSPGSNECQVAEYGENGEFMLLTRNGSQNKGTEISKDGGETLQDFQSRDDIDTTIVQSGFYQAENHFDLATPKLMVTAPTGDTRINLGLWFSYDNKNFKHVKQLMTGSASYSDLVGIDESRFCVVYNANSNTAVNLITFNLKSIFMGD